MRITKTCLSMGYQCVMKTQWRRWFCSTSFAGVLGHISKVSLHGWVLSPHNVGTRNSTYMPITSAHADKQVLHKANSMPLAALQSPDPSSCFGSALKWRTARLVVLEAGLRWRALRRMVCKLWGNETYSTAGLGAIIQ